MKRILFVAAVVAAFASIGYGQYKAGSVEQTLIDMDKAWTAAELKGDKTAAGAFVAEDFRATGQDGTIDDKASYLKGLEATTDTDMADDYNVRVFGNTAIMTHRGTVTGKNPLVYRSTHVWMKRGGKWQIVAHHSSNVIK
jgi:hypothetical protein